LDGIDEIVREFLIESSENLDQLDQDLVALESDPGSRDLLSSIFRTIHTIKGTSGFLALTDLERVAHVGENLLVELRDGKRVMNQRTTDVLLMMVDTIRALLTKLEETGEESGVEVDPTIAAIQATLDGEPLPGESDAAEADTAESDTAASEAAAELDSAAAAQSAAGAKPAVTTTPAPEQDSDLSVSASEPAQLAPSATAPAKVSKAADKKSSFDATVPAQASTGIIPRTANAPEAQEQAPAAQSSVKHSADSSIRVDVALLDELMRQVGELVLVRNHISQLAGFESGELLRSSQRLSLIASELQDGVMKTRMQPIEHIWAKMPRVVRDLAASCKREVQLEMVGGETELDRSLLESVKDPLTHLIRNAVDHGIEAPDVRESVGKPRTGRLRLQAYHAGGQVVVEVTDDGAGLDPVKIGAKAIERGLKTADQLRLMSDSEIQNLVFHAGFSTSAAVTNISGRGVGMDVVRSNIEEIGGVVELESHPGTGTTWRLRIPLTLAIMPALTVMSGNEIYAIPQANLLELVALDTRKTKEAIEEIGGCEVYRLRGGLLPLVRLTDVLGNQSQPGDNAVIAVLQADNQRFGLIVDHVLDNQEIVVKPLSSLLKSIGLYAGATLMGDGQVALILDIPAITRRELNADVTDALALEVNKHVEAAVADSTEYLVVGVGGSPLRRIAIALADVTRLEMFQVSQLEAVGSREVIQYRGDIVPVRWLGSLLGAFGAPETAEKPTVIFTRGDKTVALVVDEIIEILDDSGAVSSEVSNPGLLGSIVLNGAVTEILDTPAALVAADPTYFDADFAHADEMAFDEILAGA